MKAYSRFIILLGFIVALAGIAPAFFPTHLEARNPTPGIVSPEDQRVGGEPGEDPHLKLKPVIQVDTDSDFLGCESTLRSRVNCAWRTLLWTWLWQLQR